MLTDLKYPYQWALNVVYRLVEKHTRATETICQFYDISPRILALYLAKGDSLWPWFARRIRAIDALEERTGKHYTDVELFDWLQTLHQPKYAGNLAPRLDKGRKMATIKEQVPTEGPSASDGTGPLPFEETPYGVQLLLEFQ